VRLRHRQPLQKCEVILNSNGTGVSVLFKKPQRAATPGQFAVFYKKGVCLGGGVIV
jgi:tRNA-specific 2-thiouridylase